MEEAIIGLVGVVVGGLITAGTQVLTRRSERHAERHHAVRVVASELALFAAALTAQPLQPERIRASASSTLETWRVHRLALTWLRRRLVANGPEGSTHSGSPASGAAAPTSSSSSRSTRRPARLHVDRLLGELAEWEAERDAFIAGFEELRVPFLPRRRADPRVRLDGGAAQGALLPLARLGPV